MILTFSVKFRVVFVYNILRGNEAEQAVFVLELQKSPIQQNKFMKPRGINQYRALPECIGYSVFQSWTK